MGAALVIIASPWPWQKGRTPRLRPNSSEDLYDGVPPLSLSAHRNRPLTPVSFMPHLARAQGS